ncbi:MAG: protein translocase subunit SecD, partial [Alphaproteobacteria bacterium]|nr:protein translocase subunit SecD [Alphaproteobacteria bacterium]
MWKKLVIIFVAVFGVMLSIPTIAPNMSRFFPSWIKPVPLGLDLKGGAQLLLEVDTTTMFKEKSNQLYEEVRSTLIDRNKGVIRYANLRNNDGVISFDVRESGDVSKAKGRLRSVLGTTADIESSGDAIKISYSDKQKEEMVQDALSRSIEIVRRRIDALGTKEPSIKSQGGKYILIQLPWVDNPEHIKDLIGQTAKMTFHLVNEMYRQNSWHRVVP